MAGNEITRVVETGRYMLIYKHKIFIFDLIFNLHTDLGTALYTEGTGNLINVKAATNPVKAVFRKNTLNSDSKQGENILFSEYSTSNYSEINSSEFSQTTDPYSTDKENSIYEWIGALNSAIGLDSETFTVYGEIEAEFETDGTSSIKKKYIIPLFELTGAILVDAVIRRNVYKEGGRSFSELTFVVDSLKASTTTNNLKVLSYLGS